MQRVQEVASQKIVGATAAERVKRAQRTVITPAGQALDFQPGDVIGQAVHKTNLGGS